MARGKGKVSRKYSAMPLPSTVGELYKRDIARCWDMLDELEKTKSNRPIKWLEGMKKYWESKLRKLHDNPPKSPKVKL